MAYRLSPHKVRRAWVGEDWVFSTVLRDQNNTAKDLTGATINLVIHKNGSAVLSTDLETNDDPTDGYCQGSLTMQSLYDALTPGSHQYFVRVRQAGITHVAEAGRLEYLGGALSPDPEAVVQLIQGEGDDILEQE